MIFKIIAVVVVVLVVFVFAARKIGSSVHVEHTLAMPVTKVWTMWNDVESMKKWWGPTGYTAPIIKNDLRVGGNYLLSMRSPKGEMFYNAGTYTEIIPNWKISSTMAFSDENGKPMPGSQVKVPGEWPDFVTITVNFKDMGGETLVSIDEIGIPLIMKLFAKMGWQQQFDKMDELIRSNPNP